MTDREAVRRAYDEIAEVYAEERARDGLGTEILEGLLDRWEGDARVLDAGCGQGTPVLERISDEARAVGLDFSREQLRLARGNAPSAPLVQGDMTALPFRDGAFDAVVAYYSLIHVPLDRHGTVLEEFSRVLGPGGWLLVSEGVDRWSGTNPDWLDSGVEMQWDIAGAETTEEQLTAAGFSLVEDWAVDDELAEQDDGQHPFFLARS